MKVDRLAAINRSTGRPDLSRVRRYHTLAKKEPRRADKIKWHERALDELWKALGWGERRQRSLV